MFCLNLCDILLPQKLLDFGLNNFLDLIAKRNRKPERYYIGSNFCSQYFLNKKYWSLMREILDANMLITLVLPIFTQKDLQRGKDLISEIIGTFPEIDEITVNDYGMLNYIPENYDKKINMGRLFFKDMRDIRVYHYFKNTHTPALLSHDLEQYNINAVELDLTHQSLDLSKYKNVSYKFSLHYPLCYATYGNICKFASIDYDIEHKFRPNLPCKQNCFDYIQAVDGNNNKFDYRYYFLGRVVYFENSHCKNLHGRIDRKIYFPINDLLDVAKADNK